MGSEPHLVKGGKAFSCAKFFSEWQITSRKIFFNNHFVRAIRTNSNHGLPTGTDTPTRCPPDALTPSLAATVLANVATMLSR